ncbi:MAG: 16S rRNA (guanine(966)-N(2))-methyltransferase RsmD [Lachnospiraceae bacterium]
MRVIAGKARRMPLKTLPGLATRPTTDRTKETLFNILQPYIPGARMLDLFAGSGAIGIEALSRGASHVTFIDNSAQAIACVRENLEFTNLSFGAHMIRSEVMSALSMLLQQEPYDIVFMDPPYKQGLEEDVLSFLSKSPLLHEDTILVAEAAAATDFSYVEDLGFTVLKRKEYKTNFHIFLRKRQEV